MTGADFVDGLEQFEGCIPHLYLDSRGNVTTAVGLMLPNTTAALTLPWHDPGGAPTSPEAIAEQMRKVRGAALGHLAAWYRQFTVMRLDECSCRERCARDVDAILPQLSKMFVGFELLPLPARRALVDMAYNIGVAKLARFTNLRAAIAHGDWVTAAGECHRIGISERRNAWTAEQFRAAGGVGVT